MLVEKIMTQLHSNDPQIQEEAIKQLELFSPPIAIPLLAKCLDDTSWRTNKDVDWRSSTGEVPEGRNLYEPLSYLAVRVLARIVPNSPIDPKDQPVTITHVEKMRNWWKKNKDFYVEGGASL